MTVIPRQLRATSLTIGSTELVDSVVEACIASATARAAPVATGPCTHTPRERFHAFLGQTRSQPVYRDGTMVGYRVFPLGDRNGLDRLALVPRDLVTRFCGVNTADIHDGGDLCCSRPIGTAVELTVERGGQTVTVSAPLPSGNVVGLRSIAAWRPRVDAIAGRDSHNVGWIPLPCARANQRRGCECRRQRPPCGGRRTHRESG